MPKNETLAEQLFGSFGDDDWDDTQSTQETSHLIVILHAAQIANPLGQTANL